MSGRGGDYDITGHISKLDDKSSVRYHKIGLCAGFNTIWWASFNQWPGLCPLPWGPVPCPPPSGVQLFPKIQADKGPDKAPYCSLNSCPVTKDQSSALPLHSIWGTVGHHEASPALGWAKKVTFVHSLYILPSRPLYYHPGYSWPYWLWGHTADSCSACHQPEPSDPLRQSSAHAEVVNCVKRWYSVKYCWIP